MIVNHFRSCIRMEMVDEDARHNNEKCIFAIFHCFFGQFSRLYFRFDQTQHEYYFYKNDKSKQIFIHILKQVKKKTRIELMWQDEIDDLEYQDSPTMNTNTNTNINRKTNTKSMYSEEEQTWGDLYYQPITCLKKNILNAITGYQYPYRIGSKDELRFYIVMTSDPWEPKEACRLFFSSPEEYESFSGLTVSAESKQKFRNHQMAFRQSE